MTPVTYVPARRWRHTSGRTASIYGSVPYMTDAEKRSWRIETVGWSPVWSDGTIGTGRVPEKTLADAIARYGKPQDEPSLTVMD